jgi:hypothetical protein
LIEPAPVLASPPETLQVTAAGPPLASVAENCSTALPLEPVALQPVQLVSMKLMPGAMVNVPLAGLALTVLVPHPAKAIVKAAAKGKISAEMPVGCRRVGRLERAHILAPGAREVASRGGLAAPNFSRLGNFYRVPFETNLSSTAQKSRISLWLNPMQFSPIAR